MARGRHITICLAAAALVLAACGGDDDSADGGQDATEAVTDDAASGGEDAGAATAPDGLDIPEGTPLADSLIPELAAIPVPDGAVAYGVGDAYGEDVDPRQTAVQQVFFTQPSADIARFYIDALPAAGFTLEDGGGSVIDPAAVEPETRTVIMFTTPDGLPGQLVIDPSVVAVSQMNINVYRSGTR